MLTAILNTLPPSKEHSFTKEHSPPQTSSSSYEESSPSSTSEPPPSNEPPCNHINHRISNTDLWQAVITHPDIIKSCLHINDNHSSILSSEKYLHAYVHDEIFLINVEKLLIEFGKNRKIDKYDDIYGNNDEDNSTHDKDDNDNVDMQWLTNLNNWSSS
jgi:hypothetical protein